MARDLIALDADGVLLDFHLGYAGAWRRAFGAAPRERDPLAYWPMDRWEVTRLDEPGRAHFRRHFDDHFWSTVPAIEGAVDACQRLHDAGHLLEHAVVAELVIVFRGHRIRRRAEILGLLSDQGADSEAAADVDAVPVCQAAGRRRLDRAVLD